jgi:hypothetical protein
MVFTNPQKVNRRKGTKKIENATLGAENYFLPNRNLFYIFAHSMCMHARSMRMYAGEKRE